MMTTYRHRMDELDKENIDLHQQIREKDESIAHLSLISSQRADVISASEKEAR
jgi:hypothetical protein